MAGRDNVSTPKKEHKEPSLPPGGEERVFDADDLRRYLRPVLERLDRSDDAVPFKQPVDPIFLEIPDYFDIVDDMWLMFENAWLYNRKNSIVHKYSTKLAELFIDLINPVLQKMGYSNGRWDSMNSKTRNASVVSSTPKKEHKEPSPPPGGEERVFDADDLRRYLRPVLERLDRSDDAVPFKQPVDPILLGIPDYFDIVKKPMDLSTIYAKLDVGLYKNPGQFSDDMWLMFENAWLYNRKNSIVHKYSTKLAELFIDLINPVLQKMGYSNGRWGI